MLTRLSRVILRRTRFLSFTRATVASSTFHHSLQKNAFHNLREFSVFSKSPDYSEVPLMDLLVYESLSSETLESLTDYFEELVEADPKLKNADIAYSVKFKFVAKPGKWNNLQNFRTGFWQSNLDLNLERMWLIARPQTAKFGWVHLLLVPKGTTTSMTAGSTSTMACHCINCFRMSWKKSFPSMWIS